MSNKCKPDFPNFCPPPERPPMPCKPPVPSVECGSSLYEVVNNLTDRVNNCMRVYNEVMANCYATLRNLERAAEENGAYYGPCEVWTEQGYNANESATYTLIHKACVDRRNEPIRINLHLAYGNTTNSEIKQSLFSASKVTMADKIFVAMPLNAGGWYGNVIYNGAPIATSSQPELYTVGFTRGGVMRAYINTTPIEQMMRDTIENSMGCSGVLILNGQITDESYQQHIPQRTEQASRIVMGQNMDTREVIFLVCGNENNVNKNGMTSHTCAEILLQYGCDIAVELTEGSNAGALDKGQMLFVPENSLVPDSYCYWYISRQCFFNNDYQRELAELIQNYGHTLWHTFLNKNRIDALREDLTKEIGDREKADQVLQEQILAEVDNRIKADEVLQNQILEEVQNRVNADKVLQDQILTEVDNRQKADEVLQNQILEEVQNRINGDNTLQEAINKEITDRTEADSELQKQILEEVKNRENADESLQQQLITETNARVEYDKNLQQQIDTEVHERTNADAVLHQEILTEQGARIAADKQLQNNINAEAEARTQADTTLQQNIDSEASKRLEEDNKLQSLINDLSERVGICEGDITTLKTQYNTLQNQMASLDTSVTAIQQTITEIETSLNNIKTSIETIRGQINTINDELTKIKNGDIVLPYLPLAGGTMTGAINMGGQSLTNLATPSANTDAATKKYVDDAISGGITPPTGDYLPLTGGQMNGNIDMNNNRITSIGAPTANNDAVNKQYVDTKTNNYLPLAGGTMSGILNMNSNDIQLNANIHIYTNGEDVVIGTK